MRRIRIYVIREEVVCCVECCSEVPLESPEVTVAGDEGDVVDTECDTVDETAVECCGTL